MDIKWATLGQTFGVSVGITLAVVLVFTLGVLALARRDSAVRAGGPTAGAVSAATLCFAACLAAVGYGLYVIAAR